MDAGREFEAKVAAAYRLAGAEIQHNVSVAGNQIDLVVVERTASGASVRTAVECKAYSRPVGIDVVNAFGAIAYLLRQRHLVDRAALVGASGFTMPARAAAEQHGVDLIEYADLVASIGPGATELIEARAHQYGPEFLAAEAAPTNEKRIFVLMPFTSELEDLYVLGIREAAERLGYVVERADDIEHNSDILQTILRRIETADAIVAETTDRNANVFYEVGYSHARGKPTVLLTRQGSDIPFDLRGVNHIIYTSIVDLRERLASRLRATLGNSVG